MTSSRKPVSIFGLIPMVGLTYFASFAAALVLRSLIAGGQLAQYQLFFIPLAAFSALSVITIWWKPRAGYVAAAAMSLALIAIFFLTKDGNDVVTVLSNPARNVTQTVFYATSVPQFFTTFIFSVVGLLNLRRRAEAVA
jgi:hypothetical protein